MLSFALVDGIGYHYCSTHACDPSCVLASDHTHRDYTVTTVPSAGPCGWSLPRYKLICQRGILWELGTTNYRPPPRGHLALPSFLIGNSPAPIQRLWRPARGPERVLLAGSPFVTAHEGQFPPRQPPQPPQLAFVEAGLIGRTRGEAPRPLPAAARYRQTAPPYCHTPILLDTHAHSQAQASSVFKQHRE